MKNKHKLINFTIQITISQLVHQIKIQVNRLLKGVTGSTLTSSINSTLQKLFYLHIIYTLINDQNSP